MNYDDIDDRIRSAQVRASGLRRLDECGLRRTQTGYYYIAHYYPLKAMEPVSPPEAVRLLEPMAGAAFETYLHFPFCEIKCSFCHFYKETLRHGQLDAQAELVSALCKELMIYKSLLGRIRARSFYIGGGTPSLIDNGLLRALLKAADVALDRQTDAEIKFELFPKTYDATELKEKLAILHDWGTTDLVIDLESGNQDVLRRIGRGISSLDGYVRLVDTCVDAGFESIISALIIGLPGETFASLHRTLEVLCDLPAVQTINTFPLITRPPDPIFKQLTRAPERFHSAESRDELWLFARSYLKDRGFHEGPISYWSRPDKRPKQQSDKFDCVNLLGFGPSGFGYLNHANEAAQYFNSCNRRDYYDHIGNDRPAIWRSGVMDNEERARRKLIFGLANCGPESLVDIEYRFDLSVDALVGSTLNLLLELDLIQIIPDAGAVRYTEDGLCRLEEISYFLGSDFVKDRVSLPNGIGPDADEIRRHNYYIDVRPEDRKRFEALAGQRSSEFIWRLPRTLLESRDTVLSSTGER